LNLTQTYTGGTAYYPDYLEGPHHLLVAVVCTLGDLSSPIHALLDTASEWCILPIRLAEDLELDLEPDGITPPLHSRFGQIEGRLERLLLSFLAMEGGTVDVQATCFVSRDWSGPMVIGWKGCLERVPFGLEPSEGIFYFSLP
jgi:hypothetical protein